MRVFYLTRRLALIILAAAVIFRLAETPAFAEAAPRLHEMQVLDIGALLPVSAPPDIYRYRLNGLCVRTEKPLPVLSGMTDMGVLLADADGQYHLGLAGQPAVRALWEICG